MISRTTLPPTATTAQTSACQGAEQRLQSDIQSKDLSKSADENQVQKDIVNAFLETASLYQSNGTHLTGSAMIDHVNEMLAESPDANRADIKATVQDLAAASLITSEGQALETVDADLLRHQMETHVASDRLEQVPSSILNLLSGGSNKAAAVLSGLLKASTSVACSTAMASLGLLYLF